MADSDSTREDPTGFTCFAIIVGPEYLIRRADAKRLGLARYFTGRPCPQGHVSERDTKHANCLECLRVKAAEWEKRNPERARKSANEWRAANWDRVLEQSKEQYRRHKPKRLARQKQRRTDDPELYIARSRAAYRKNPLPAYLACARRRAAKKRAVPVWADKAALRAVYAEALRLTKITGIRHEVDHIIPLQGTTACGLHVAENLQIITGTENRQKFTKYISAAPAVPAVSPPAATMELPGLPQESGQNLRGERRARYPRTRDP